MQNNIISQLGYISIKELRKEYNGILILTIHKMTHEVTSRLLYERCLFSIIGYSKDKSKVIVEF